MRLHILHGRSLGLHFLPFYVEKEWLPGRHQGQGYSPPTIQFFFTAPCCLQPLYHEPQKNFLLQRMPKFPPEIPTFRSPAEGNPS